MKNFPFLPEDHWKAEIRNKQHQELLREQARIQQQKIKDSVQYFLNLKNHGSIPTDWER